MATAAYSWRNTVTASTNYVCSYTGSDYYGNGTQAKPYKTLTKAYYTNPAFAIICRGIFTDNLTGRHNSHIDADYYGAAVWDGQNVSNLYGFQHSNMIFVNSGISAGYVGVGGAHNAGYVGAANLVNGLAGSPTLADNCALYFGVVGGNSTTNNIVYSRIKSNLNYRVNFTCYSGQSNQNNTVFGIEKLKMIKSISSFLNSFWLFSQTAIYIDQAGTFNKCMFSSDCTWWFTTGLSGAATGNIYGYTLASGGIGYTIGDIITVNGGTKSAKLLVKTVSETGAITAFGLILDEGDGYTVSNGKTTTAITGGGSGATINVQSISNRFIPYKSYGTLTSDITSTSTTIPYALVGTQAIPQVGIISLNGEEISYTSNTGSELLDCVRGINGTETKDYSVSTILISGEMASIVEKRRLLNTGVIFENCKYTNQPASLILDKRINLYDTATNWEYVTFGTGCIFYSDSTTEFTPIGTTDIGKMESIVSKALEVTGCTFLSCRYNTTGESIQLFNNAQKQDYTLNPLSDAVLRTIDPIFPSVRFYGALKPAFNIPIMSDSTGKAATWDEKTIDTGGLIYIQNDELHFHETGINPNTALKVASSSITSKVLKINNDKYLVDGIKSILFPIFNTNIEVEGAISYIAGNTLPIGKYKVFGTAGNQITFRLKSSTDTVYQTLSVGDTFYATWIGFVYTNVSGNPTVKSLSNASQKFYLGETTKKLVNTSKINTGTPISIGSYIVCGNRVQYNSLPIVVVPVGQILVATTANLTFSDMAGGIGYLLEILDPNVTNPVLVRVANVLGNAVEQNVSLISNQTYYNNGTESITAVLNGSSYTIAPSESFVAKTNSDYFTGTSQVNTFLTTNESEWMTINAFEDLWYMTNGGSNVYTDSNTRPASSGNAQAWALTGNVKNIISSVYLQFKIILNQYDTV